MTTKQSILLAGASGVLGRHITRALTEAGHEVTGLGRGPANDVRADLMDRDALLRAVDGRHHDTVVLAATALRKAPCATATCTRPTPCASTVPPT